MNSRLWRFGVLALSIGLSAIPANAGVVYIGLDPSAHYPSHPEGVTLTTNAVTWAAGTATPSILLVGDGSTFAASTAALLTAAGFGGMYTQIAPSGLAAATLGLYDVLYFAPTTDSTDVAFFAASAAAVAGYVAGGGGLVVEPEVFAVGSWGWVPYAGLIGHSGGTNVGDESVSIVAPLHPVMAGLTNAGLSNWGFSTHTTFSTPGAAGFTTLTLDANAGVANIIALDNQAVPEPGTIVLLGSGLLGLYAIRRRRA